MLNGYRTIVYDCEVFHSDWLFVFKDGDDYASFWNDPEGLKDYVDDNADALFAGYNSSRYDQYILKAILAGCDPEQVKEVNDYIIGTDNLPWEHPYLDDFYYPFNDVDLMKDTQMGTSLKSIEGHAGMSVEESNVPFDIDRELTEEERVEVEKYCRHDVDATAQLLEMRTDYLLTKANLGERAGLEAPRAMALTNAKLTAAVLGAQRVEHDDERAYAYPDNLLREYVPQEVFEFFDRVGDPSVPDEELWKSKLEIEVGGCPVTLGFGGIHGALPKWKGESDSKMQLVNADVASYYPSLMIYNGYTSRNMPHPDVFKGIYEERLAAKAAGDKATANALKLIVNTTYGATLNQYNDLYDPLMARSVCISGQLYLLELACHLVRDVEGLVLVQLNTDGILVMAPKNSKTDKAFMAIVNEWQERTHFALEFDKIKRIWQKDVNNYAMMLADGHEKVKGGYLVRGASTVGAFSINNNATIVADALKSYLLYDVPVAETVMACDDPSKFQLIAKAGHKYSEVYQEVVRGDSRDQEEFTYTEKVPVQKCNRVYATTDPFLGRLYKVKAEDGRVAKVESLPDHCLLCNDKPPSILNIDKPWYVALAEKRAQDFESEEEMTEEVKEATPKTTAKRSTAKKAAANDYSKMNIFQKLAVARRMFLDAGVKKSGMNRHLEFEYWTLDDIAPTQTRIFEEVGLLEVFTYVPGEDKYVGRMGSFEDGTVFEHADSLGIATVYNVNNPDEKLEFRIRWVDLPMQKNKEGKSISNPVQDLGKVQTYLRRYLKMQVLDLSEPDEIDAGAGEPEKEKAPSASKTEIKATVKTAPKKASKPATASERRKAAKKVSAPDGEASGLQVNQLKKNIRKMMDTYSETHPEVGAYVTQLGADTDNLKNITKARCEQAIRDLGEMKEKFETEGAED